MRIKFDCGGRVPAHLVPPQLSVATGRWRKPFFAPAKANAKALAGIQRMRCRRTLIRDGAAACGRSSAAQTGGAPFEKVTAQFIGVSARSHTSAPGAYAVVDDTPPTIPAFTSQGPEGAFSSNRRHQPPIRPRGRPFPCMTLAGRTTGE